MPLDVHQVEVAARKLGGEYIGPLGRVVVGLTAVNVHGVVSGNVDDLRIDR